MLALFVSIGDTGRDGLVEYLIEQSTATAKEYALAIHRIKVDMFITPGFMAFSTVAHHTIVALRVIAVHKKLLFLFFIARRVIYSSYALSYCLSPLSRDASCSL